MINNKNNAIHVAGHLLALRFFDHDLSHLHRVSLMEKEVVQGKGYTLREKGMVSLTSEPLKAIHHIYYLLGGDVAEEVMLGKSSPVEMMHDYLSILSKVSPNVEEDGIVLCLNAYKSLLTEFFAEHIGILQTLVETLLERQEMSRMDVLQIINDNTQNISSISDSSILVEDSSLNTHIADKEINGNLVSK